MFRSICLAVVLLLSVGAAAAGERPIAFAAEPVSCEHGPSREFVESGGQRLAWVDENTLHVESLQDLSSYAEVKPGSGSLNDSMPGKIEFTYRFKDPGPEPGQPYDMCGQMFIFTFTVTSLPRGDYAVSLKGIEVEN
jgi:hypothetical protein